ncbi:MAG TPA: prenyltransferase/squalene oxidase repeat-containing protein [Planctomycetota bacterium]|nr:prenyltransferase/squalene oxidase repeat-containing protein [Planctomycetota bacterium]
MISERRLEEAGFEGAVQEMVKMAPWWLISAVFHGVVLLIMWQIPMTVEVKATVARMQSDLTKEMEEPEVPLEEPEPEIPEEQIVEKIETEELSDHNEVDTDSEFEETAGEDGISDAPFTGPSTNSAIGLGGGAGGGKRGRGGHRNLKAGGGSGLTENAVELGLKWLADHQDVDEDGKWDCDDFMKHDPADDKCDGAGGALYDVGVTGLAILAFLGAGYTDRGSAKENRYAKNVRAGLRFLMQSQSDDGVFGTRATHAFMYNHAIATLAMCEAFWMTRNPRYKKPAQDGLNFIAMARNPYLAWRYEPRGGENDSSVTGWCVMALKSGKYAGLEVDPDAFEGARQWIDKMTEPNFGQVGYNAPGGMPARPEGKQDKFPAEKSHSMTGVGILCRIFLGEDPKTSEIIRKGANLCVDLPPKWNPDDGSIDMYYWYYATLALFQVGGTPWKKWNDAMVDAIVKHQNLQGTGSRTGSWDPIGVWGDDGGRVYSTAVLVMCLEIYYRYDRVFGAK